MRSKELIARDQRRGVWGIISLLFGCGLRSGHHAYVGWVGGYLDVIGVYVFGD